MSDRAVENQSIEEVGKNASSSKKRIAEKETVDGNAVAYDYQLLRGRAWMLCLSKVSKEYVG